MTQEVYNQVKDYVVANYKQTFKAEDNLIIKEMDNHFRISKNATESPLILGKSILEN
jgi:hypothetical protein